VRVLESLSSELSAWIHNCDDVELAHHGWSRASLEVLKEQDQTRVVSNGEVSSVIFYNQLDRDHYEILFLATSQQFRKQGELERLLKEFMNTLSPCLVWLECRQDNAAALKLYRKCGFKEDGLRPAYYKDGMAAVTMSFKS